MIRLKNILKEETGKADSIIETIFVPWVQETIDSFNDKVINLNSELSSRGLDMTQHNLNQVELELFKELVNYISHIKHAVHMDHEIDSKLTSSSGKGSSH